MLKLIQEVPIIFERYGKLTQEPNLRLYHIANSNLYVIHWYNLSTKEWELKHTYGRSQKDKALSVLDARKAKNQYFYEVEYPEIQRRKMEERAIF